MEQAGDQFITFLDNFINEYPDYTRLYRSIGLAGEGYAGKYIPYFSMRI